MSAAHPLDRPMWHALGGPQAALDVGQGAVRRIDPAYGPFAGCAPGGEDQLAALVAGVVGVCLGILVAFKSGDRAGIAASRVDDPWAQERRDHHLVG